MAAWAEDDRTGAPQAAIVFDEFPIMRYLGKALDGARDV